MARAFPERTLEIEGQSYRLVLDINAQVLIEETKGCVFQDVVKRMLEGSRTDERLLFWAGLQRHHPDITLAKAGDLMSAAAELPEAMMAGALQETTPDPQDTKALGMKPKRPRKAPAA